MSEFKEEVGGCTGHSHVVDLRDKEALPENHVLAPHPAAAAFRTTSKQTACAVAALI